MPDSDVSVRKNVRALGVFTFPPIESARDMERRVRHYGGGVTCLHTVQTLPSLTLGPLALMIARLCLAPFTWTELARELDPIGNDRGPFDLALKHGMRDGYICPVGGRWLVAFWSPRLLGHTFTQQARGLLYMAASMAAVRLESLVGDDPKRVGSRTCLSPRQLSVLQQISNGLTLQETAKALGLGRETALSHLKNAQQGLEP